MLICSVCRSQNMDTAKFCGNCGSPFTQASSSIPASPTYTTSAAASAATSSLITCTQGHIYSSVYQTCPYCPQIDSESISDYETRVEDPAIPITAVDIPMSEYATQSGVETLFEPIETQTAIQSAQSPKTTQSPAMTPTEVMPAISAKEHAVEKVQAPEIRRQIPPEVPPQIPVPQPLPPEPPRVELPRVEPPRVESPLKDAYASTPSKPAATPPVSKPESVEPERRTIVVPDPAQPLRSSKGRIVGWLITYSHNPDGDDYRIYAGYNRIGANPVCDIIIGDDTVSGSHAIIVYRDGRCLIKDDLSRNGTYVNGREIGEAYPLQSYDQVRIGNTYLTFISAQRIT